MADFSHVDLSLAPRLLVHSAASHRDPTVFHTNFVYPEPELAGFLAEHGVILYGADGPSMDDWQSAELPGHNALLRNGISIIEGLDLSGVPDGVYEFVGLPLKIAGGDGTSRGTDHSQLTPRAPVFPNKTQLAPWAPF